MPVPEGLNNLPVYLQAGSVVVATIIGGAIAFFGYTKKWLDKLPQPQKITPTDAVLVSGAFADTKPMMELVSEVKKLRGEVGEMVACIQQNNALQRTQNAAIDGMAEQVSRLVRVEMSKDQ